MRPDAPHRRVHNVKRIRYSSPFVPAEWIVAHGLAPVLHTPRGGARGGPIANREGVCAFLRAFVNEAAGEPDTAGLVLATTCDQMRRAADDAARGADLAVFLLNVPATWQTPAPHAMFRAELERLGRFLVEQGGAVPSRDELSRVLLEAEAATVPPASPDHGAGIPVAILGGPLAAVDRSLVAAIEKAGGRIVLDATEGGERTRRAPFDRRRLGTDPLGALVESYFGAIPDVFQRPNTALFNWLRARIRERGVRGVVLLRYVWCDLWHAELRRFQEWLEVPVIDVDVNGEAADSRNLVRIQAFLEGLAQ